MARSYARIVTAIWRNQAFRSLDPAAQWLYILLVTQPDISAAGMLPLTLRRWAQLAEGCTAEQVAASLRRLDERRFVSVDHDTEEVLVRSFVRWDGGYGNRKRLPVIHRAALEVVSPGLRSVLRFELDRLGVTVDGLSDALSDDPSDPETGAEPTNTPSESDTSTFPQVDRLSDAPSNALADAPSLFEGVVVGYVSREVPQPTTHNPPPSGGEPSSPPINKRAQALAKVYTDLVPLSRFPAVMAVAKKAITAGYADDRIADGLRRLAADGRSVTVDALRYELDGFPADRARPAQPRLSTADQRVAAAEALKDNPDPRILALGQPRLPGPPSVPGLTMLPGGAA